MLLIGILVAGGSFTLGWIAHSVWNAYIKPDTAEDAGAVWDERIKQYQHDEGDYRGG